MRTQAAGRRSRISGSAVPGSSIDKEQPDDERKQQNHDRHHHDSKQQLIEDHCTLRIRGLRRIAQAMANSRPEPNLSVD
jgi:hypothetical protein